MWHVRSLIREHTVLHCRSSSSSSSRVNAGAVRKTINQIMYCCNSKNVHFHVERFKSTDSIWIFCWIWQSDTKQLRKNKYRSQIYVRLCTIYLRWMQFSSGFFGDSYIFFLRFFWRCSTLSNDSAPMNSQNHLYSLHSFENFVSRNDYLFRIITGVLYHIYICLKMASKQA